MIVNIIALIDVRMIGDEPSVRTIGNIIWAHEELKQLFDGLADVVVRLSCVVHAPGCSIHGDF